VYQYLGRGVDEYILSEEFFNFHDISAGEHALPEEYPAWINLIEIQCRVCFEKRHKTDPTHIAGTAKK
jgi:hypothetical protein